jgi:hypothetical protein
MQPIITLPRTNFTEAGTEGVFCAPGFACFSLELPWRNNLPNISCIPVGEYQCGIVNSPRFGRVFQVFDVPDRTHVLLHRGNFAGDTAQGLRSDVAGCVLLGRRLGFLHGQRAILTSRITVRRFMAAMDEQGITNFTLKIREH